MSQEVTRLEEILKDLTPEQLKYISIRPHVKYDYQAAEKMDIARETVGRWENKPLVDEAVKLMLLDGVIVAGEILRRSLSQAAQELANELEHKRVDIRHKAATQILDRQMGKAAQPMEHTGKGGDALVINLSWGDDGPTND